MAKKAEKVPRFDQILLRSKYQNSPKKFATDSKKNNLNVLDLDISMINPNEGLFENKKI